VKSPAGAPVTRKQCRRFMMWKKTNCRLAKLFFLKRDPGQMNRQDPTSGHSTVRDLLRKQQEGDRGGTDLREGGHKVVTTPGSV